MQTALCPIVEVVPRSLDENGNFRIASPVDEYGWGVENTPMDEMRVVEPVRLVGATFVGNTVDNNFWSSSAANGASVIQTNGEMILASGSATGASAILQTNRKARYTGGAANRFRAQLQLSDIGKDNNVKKWGMFDGSNGAYFKLTGSYLGVCSLRDGSESEVAASNWNNQSTASPTLTNINSYEIYATNGKVYFSVAGELAHTISATASPWSSTLTLPLRIENSNSAAAASSMIRTRVATIYRLGKLETLPTYKNFTGASTANVCKYGPGNLHRITINDPVNSTITIYDNVGASPPLIASLITSGTTDPFSVEYHVPFANGLCITTGGAYNLTVVYE